MQNIYLTIVLSPLIGALIAGLLGKAVGRRGAHSAATLSVAISTALSLYALKVLLDAKGAGLPYVFNETIYTWLVSGDLRLEVGFLIDELSATMMAVVTFVSLMVHIYTIGYMQDDPGYQRFFSYISAFTFAMLMLVMSNNFLQLFFGWEGVGLVSYLLIGFWYKKETAIYANMKAFLVNRVGDLGMLLGMATLFTYFGTLDFSSIFAEIPQLVGKEIEVLPGYQWQVLSMAAILLFIGAMAKSAQVPLHVWLPDSMEGPTPISALIHAATMVTAGIFLVARMSPLFEMSEAALGFVLIIGAITALFMGFLGVVQSDIKRVIAYSTLSQLGYMTVALGVSAYSAAMFHLVTHAFFKALLFLGAGSVIIALHHEQNMHKMGGLRTYLPITYITTLLGTLALVGFPGFAGFFSKDAIIEAVHHSQLPGAGVAYIFVLIGVFFTALYSFRLLFLVFHGEERIEEGARAHLHEPPAVVTGPLIMLAIPSVVLGAFLIGPMLFGDYFGAAIQVAENHDVLAEVGANFHGPLGFMLHGLMGWAFYLMLAGTGTAWFFYLKRPDLPAKLQARFSGLHRLLDQKYYMDAFNARFFAGGLREIGGVLWRVFDQAVIDGVMVNGSARAIGWCGGKVRQLQSGLLYHYAFSMVVGLTLLLSLIWIL